MPARMRGSGVHSGRGEVSATARAITGEMNFERKRTMENKKKKRYGIIAALLLLVMAAGVGTYAWLTAQEHIDNVFTVGSFGHPENKPDPTNPRNRTPIIRTLGKVSLRDPVGCQLQDGSWRHCGQEPQCRHQGWL